MNCIWDITENKEQINDIKLQQLHRICIYRITFDLHRDPVVLHRVSVVSESWKVNLNNLLKVNIEMLTRI